MEKYNVYGMSCAACSSRVEKAVSGVDGVDACSVNLLTNSMTVEGNFSENDILSAVKNAGYSARNIKTINTDDEIEIKDTKTSILANKLVLSVLLTLILMYFSMGYTMWNFPLPMFFDNNPVAITLVQMLLAISVMIINSRYFISGAKAIVNKSPNMDTLVSMGSLASFIYSTFVFFKMINFAGAGDMQAATHLLHDLYFESSAMILAFINIGKTLESYSKGKTTNAIKSLIKLQPKNANIIVDDKEVTVPAKDVKIGDIFVVRPGESIPVDACVLEGGGAVDESCLTGESIPVDKQKGDNVYAATVNMSGFIKCKAIKVSEDTTISQIIKMVTEASSGKAPISKIADKVSGIFVPVVMVISLVTLIMWMFVGQSFGFAIARAISVLVISCPCALGLATPVAIMVGNGIGAKNGILFKTAVSLENTGKIKNIVFDKTGTLTTGKPVVCDVVPTNNFDKTKLLEIAKSIEIKSSHPLADAICDFAEKKGICAFDVTDFENLSGFGVKAKYNEIEISGGNLRLIKTISSVSDDIIEIAENFSKQGKTPMFFSYGCEVCGIIAVADEIKKDAKTSISTLKNMGIKTVMLTGDNKNTADFVANSIGIDKVVSDLLPKDKEENIKLLQKEGLCCMVGDGINDAVALTRADIGVAVGAGTDIAIDSADVVVVNSNISDVVNAIKISKATIKNIHENLFWAFFYNSIGIPVAAGLFYKFGLVLNPMIAAGAMSLSSVFVVCNALRLNTIKITNKLNKKEKRKMELVITVDGMMCPHCEANVKKNLEEIQGVESVVADHTAKKVTIKLSKEIDKQIFVDKINSLGYKA